MAWMNLDMHGYEIESNTTYCEGCDKSGIEFEIIPRGPYYEKYRCLNCGWVYPYLFESLEGLYMHYYLLQNSDYDEGVSPFDKAMEQKRAHEIADLYRI